MENLQEYITDPFKLGRHEADSMDTLREKYPYFQALHILIAKCHKNQNTFGFNKNLKLASLYAGDRKVLYNFINSEEKSAETQEVVVDQIITLVQEQNVSVKEHLIPETPKIEVSSSQEEITDSNEVIIQMEEVIPLPEKKPIFEVVSKQEDKVEEVIIEKIEVDSNLETQIEQATEKTDTEVLIQDTNEIVEESIKPEIEELTEKESSIEETPIEPIEIINENISEITETVPAEIESSHSADENISEEGIDEKEYEVASKEEVELIAKTEIIKVDINLSEKEEKDTLTDDISESDEQDFLKWLDNFALDDTNKLPEVQPQQEDDIDDDHQVIPEEESLETKEIDSFKEDSEEQSEVALPINFEVESDDETEYDPAAWAEIAYEIQAFVKTPEVPEEKIFTPKKVSKDEIDDLLDRFIKKNPSISRPKAEFYKPENMARKSEEFHAEVVSESLAQLFYKQGLLHKSLEIYEKLMLQNPDKKDIFAARIKSIKDELINQL